MSSQPSGSTTTISASGTASAIPEASPPPPHGTTMRGGEPPSCSIISRPAVPCPATIAGSSKLGHHRCARFVCDPRRDRLAALCSPIVEDDLRALGASAFDLHLRRIGRHDDDRPNTEPLRRNRNATSVIARRKGDDAPLPLFGRKLQQPVGRAAQLERATSLQTFTFQPDARAADLALDQWGLFDEPARSAPPAASTSSRVTIVWSAKSLISHPFDQPLQFDDKSPEKCRVRVQKIFTAGPPSIYRASAAPWDFQPQGSSFRNVPVGGPLSCTSIIARWG